eukprot:TRINITY_DN3995_c0_g3_i3.p1 TRINITY_DN3995_c0_g3~~TRINITY_DN3995_c0_g3_i3.p1  ORF type:complete len:342 (-),score=39.36 TRINITY_DN3995_c0_g3_i3:4-1029(-)
MCIRDSLIILKWISQFCTYLMNNVFDYRGIDLLKIFNTFRGSLLDELDFTLEAKNAKKTAALFKGNNDIYIPRVYSRFSSRRVLIMEFVEGAKINDKDGIKKMGLDPLQTARLLIDIFGKMIFIHGHIHCDAHPGNIFIRRNPKDKSRPQLVLLDHGLYRELPLEFRQRFCKLYTAMISFDYKTMKEVAEELGVGEYYRYLPLIFTFRTKISNKKIGAQVTEEERKWLRENTIVTFENINHLMQALPADMLFIIRASNLVAIHNTVLGGTTRDRLLTFTDYAYKAIYTNPITFYWEKFKFTLKVFLFEKLNMFFKLMFAASYTSVDAYQIDMYIYLSLIHI